MSNANFSTIIASTLQNFSNQIMDNVITNNAVFYYMKQKGNYKVVSGGRSFVEQLWWRANPSFAARDDMDTITPAVTDGHTASEWAIKVISGAIALPLLDVAMNSGSKEQLLNYAMAKKKEAETSLGQVMAAQLFNTAVVAANGGGVNWNSIPEIISEDPSTETNTVGGIVGSTHSYWRNYSYDTAVSGFNTNQAGLIAIETSLNSCTFGPAGPKLMVTTPAIFTLFQIALTALQRYANMDEPGNIGFQRLTYANIPVVYDNNCIAGNLYGIDTEAVKLKVLSQGNFKNTPFQIKTDQLVDTALMYVFGNLACDSRRSNFVIDSITA